MSLARHLKRLLEPGPTRAQSARFRTVDDERLSRVRESLVQHYFDRRSPEYLESSEGRADLANHLAGRLEHDRRVVVPWLDGVRPLGGARVLEIGCGTGCSTVALAEQGALVTGVDIDAPAMQVARARFEAFGLDVELVEANAADLSQTLAGQQFDFVIFYASLEHMTSDERLSAIAGTWPLVSRDGLWCVVETPNRLWYYDGHTALLPFFMWLPDDLALRYTKLSPRPGLRDRFDEANNDGQLLEFLRQGRGVSYHEFELALGIPAHQLPVASALATRSRRVNLLRQLRFPRPLEVQYTRLMRQVYPSLDPAFLLPQLDLALAPSRVGKNTAP